MMMKTTTTDEEDDGEDEDTYLTSIPDKNGILHPQAFKASSDKDRLINEATKPPSKVPKLAAAIT